MTREKDRMFLGAIPKTGIYKCIHCYLDFKLLTRLFETVIIVKVPEENVLDNSGSHG